jgi:thioredoxin-like negative regulator of GroEL
LLEEAKYDEAIETLQRAVASNPRDYMAHFKLAQAYAQADQPKLAAAEQATAEKIRRIRKEFSDLHQVAWNNPHDIRTRLRLAQLAKELGREDLEQTWLKSAAALQPLPDSSPQTQ